MNIYIVIDIIFLVVITILLARSDDVNWLTLFTGFIMGVTVYELLIFFRNRQRKTRKLR